MNPIAVVGISNLFPGSKNPQEFWDNLIEKKDTRSRLTSDDVGIELEHYIGKQSDVDKLYCEFGGYIRNFVFDPTQYQLNADKLQSLDELYQWTLYTAREALIDANVLDNSELLKRCGVILANLSFPTRTSNALVLPMYASAIESSLEKLAFPNGISLPIKALHSDKDNHADNMLIAGYPAALVSKALGLGGVNFSLDAACASSCYSVKLACDYLNTGKADIMLSGAVSASDPLFISMGFSIFHAYPDDERSAPLDANSKGLFAGEGAAFFVLKRYEDAVR
ncbi:MAG: polyketide synthase, partial [Pseudomonadota bacterium]